MRNKVTYCIILMIILGLGMSTLVYADMIPLGSKFVQYSNTERLVELPSPGKEIEILLIVLFLIMGISLMTFKLVSKNKKELIEKKLEKTKKINFGVIITKILLVLIIIIAKVYIYEDILDMNFREYSNTFKNYIGVICFSIIVGVIIIFIIIDKINKNVYSNKSKISTNLLFYLFIIITIILGSHSILMYREILELSDKKGIYYFFNYIFVKMIIVYFWYYLFIIISAIDSLLLKKKSRLYFVTIVVTLIVLGLLFKTFFECKAGKYVEIEDWFWLK